MTQRQSFMRAAGPRGHLLVEHGHLMLRTSHNLASGYVLGPVL